MLNTRHPIVPTLSRLPLVPLRNSDTYSLSSGSKNHFPTNTKVNVTVNPSQTLYKPPTAPTKIGQSACLPSLSLNANPKNASPVSTKKLHRSFR